MLARSGAHLIHMLAKQETPMKVSNTVLGRVPAKFKMRVIKMRSMFVLLSAEEMVKPPIRSMIVGENITEKTYLHTHDMSERTRATVKARTWSRRGWKVASAARRRRSAASG